MFTEASEPSSIFDVAVCFYVILIPLGNEVIHLFFLSYAVGEQ